MGVLHDTLRHAFSGRLLTDADETRPFTTDWRGLWSDSAFAVAQPDSSDDVAAVLRWCRGHRVPVVPRGGIAGLSGGSVPDASGRSLVLSLGRLHRIRAIDTADFPLSVEPLEHAQARIGAALTAFELINATSLELVLRHMPAARSPLSARSPWYVLIEVSKTGDETGDETSVQTRADRSLEALLEAALQRELMADAALASSLAQDEVLWALRENISEAQPAEGKCIKHDISLPISRIPTFIASTDAAVARHFPGVRLVVFGHLGDGNLHYNVSPAAPAGAGDTAAGFAAIEPAMNRLVHDSVDRHGGSISAEHGVGVLRRDEAARYKSPTELRLMRSIKQALDPRGLLNPGKLFAEANP